MTVTATMADPYEHVRRALGQWLASLKLPPVGYLTYDEITRYALAGEVTTAAAMGAQRQLEGRALVPYWNLHEPATGHVFTVCDAPGGEVRRRSSPPRRSRPRP